MADCEIWADVDFGRGPVEVRCTVPGEHKDHICKVFLNVDVNEPVLEHKSNNVFNEKKSLETGNIIRQKKRW